MPELPKTVRYQIGLEDNLRLIRDGLTEVYAANAAEPYDHRAYERASELKRVAVRLLVGDDPEAEVSLCEDLYDWTSEPIGRWFVYNWMIRDNRSQLNGRSLEQFRTSKY